MKGIFVSRVSKVRERRYSTTQKTSASHLCQLQMENSNVELLAELRWIGQNNDIRGVF